MRFRYRAALLLSLLGSLLPAASPPANPEAQKISALLRKIKGSRVAERIEKFSEKFIGVLYEDSPLGEGPHGKYDKNPLYRTDLFDCTTYVETVLALAISKELSDFERNLKRIRYKNGDVNFTSRNHFPCADWIPNNESVGFLTDVTAQVAGASGTRMATAIVDKKGWYENLPDTAIRVPGLSQAERDVLLKDLHAEGAKFEPKSVSLTYLPLDAIIQRKAVSPEETEKRKQEEEAYLAQRTKEGAGLTGEALNKFETATHTGLVDLRFRYVLKEAQVDPKFLEAVPSGVIMNVVRPNWKIPGSHMNVSHQGFIIRKNGEPYFRHVSRSGGERIKDVSLANYLRLTLLTPQVKGINLLQANEQRDFKELTLKHRH
jgi:Protein of unknown function (DUF1460)